MKVTKKQVTTTLNIKSKTEIKEEDLLEFAKEWEGREDIFNFEVLDSDSDSDYFYYVVTFEETTIL